MILPDSRRVWSKFRFLEVMPAFIGWHTTPACEMDDERMLPRLRSVYSGILFDSAANILQKKHHFSKAARARQGPAVETVLIQCHRRSLDGKPCCGMSNTGEPRVTRGTAAQSAAAPAFDTPPAAAKRGVGRATRGQAAKTDGSSRPATPATPAVTAAAPRNQESGAAAAATDRASGMATEPQTRLTRSRSRSMGVGTSAPAAAAQPAAEAVRQMRRRPSEASVAAAVESADVVDLCDTSLEEAGGAAALLQDEVSGQSASAAEEPADSENDEPVVREVPHRRALLKLEMRGHAQGQSSLMFHPHAAAVLSCATLWMCLLLQAACCIYIQA